MYASRDVIAALELNSSSHEMAYLLEIMLLYEHAFKCKGCRNRPAGLQADPKLPTGRLHVTPTILKLNLYGR